MDAMSGGFICQNLDLLNVVGKSSNKYSPKWWFKGDESHGTKQKITKTTNPGTYVSKSIDTKEIMFPQRIGIKQNPKQQQIRGFTTREQVQDGQLLVCKWSYRAPKNDLTNRQLV